MYMEPNCNVTLVTGGDAIRNWLSEKSDSYIVDIEGSFIMLSRGEGTEFLVVPAKVLGFGALLGQYKDATSVITSKRSLAVRK